MKVSPDLSLDILSLHLKKESFGFIPSAIQVENPVIIIERYIPGWLF